MRSGRHYLDGLARLHRIGASEERRGTWRQSMAALAAEAADQRPVPLEGLDPAEVLASTRAALGFGLIDDLGFLSPAHAAAALYELASVLAPGDEKRELGRRVAQYLHQGDAATFVALSTRLALASRRALSGPAVRARVALALDLPIGSGVRADGLALALVSRRELLQEWLVGPSQGSLPSRRLAARLIERAAREAARRAARGDDGVVAVFERPIVRAAWDRLLADREPLVWRHVATARGLLSQAVRTLDEEILAALDPTLTPTEWRRAAASLAASIAVAPQQSMLRATALLEGPLLAKDRGLPGAMILGLPRAAEAEPDTAEELCVALVRAGGVDAAEALLSLRHERVGGDFGVWASQMARAKLREERLEQSADDGLSTLALALDQDLRAVDEREWEPTLRMRLDDALLAFATEDARAAHARAQAVLTRVGQVLGKLEAANPTSAQGRRESYLALRELDSALLETSTLGDLLTLGARGDDATASAPLGPLFDRLTAWLVRHESKSDREGSVSHPTLRLQRLRTLLHAIDADGSYGDGRGTELRDRRLRTVRVLLDRVRAGAPAPLRRVLTAATARACDAMLREEIGELSDVLLAVARDADTLESLSTMAEASMVPEMQSIFRAYAVLVERSQRGETGSGTRARAMLDALRTLQRTLPIATSPRVDALHEALLAYANAVERVMASSCLAELLGEPEGSGSAIAALEAATRLLVRLVVGARRRLGESIPESSSQAGAALRLVDLATERAYRGDAEALAEAVASCVGALHEDLPAHLAEAAADALVRTLSLSRERDPTASKRESFKPAPPKEAALPPWLPPSRSIGGFYVLRALGSGAVGSVFVAKRIEERKDDGASRFALKVPEYGGSAARTLSEEEFHQLFRQEAGALLSIPQHPNLARLVTFDAGARPKPILVMELVEGPTLERAVETGAIDVAETFELLDGIAAGLSAMHHAGVGHLDVKPSNVILRDADVMLGTTGTPVLVDFGLAGRHIRPGCATASYGAPEIWGLVPKGVTPEPMAADVYAFGCVAFEILTGRELVHGPSEVSVITAHLSHDGGDLDGLQWLAADPELTQLANVLGAALRQDPRRRAPIAELRVELAACGKSLASRSWPLGS